MKHFKDFSAVFEINGICASYPTSLVFYSE